MHRGPIGAFGVCIGPPQTDVTGISASTWNGMRVSRAGVRKTFLGHLIAEELAFFGITNPESYECLIFQTAAEKQKL